MTFWAHVGWYSLGGLLGVALLAAVFWLVLAPTLDPYDEATGVLGNPRRRTPPRRRTTTG